MEQKRIKSKQDLRNWLSEDSQYYSTQKRSILGRIKINMISHPCMDQLITWKYVRALRYAEYHINNHGIIHTFKRLWYLRRLRQLGYKTGFQIPPNVVGPGLNLPHYGVIIVNDRCKIGSNVTMYSGVCIGWKKRNYPCPTIGENVFIGMGTKIIGDVHVGDNVTIGQNCVVVKDIKSNSTVVAQQPIKIK